MSWLKSAINRAAVAAEAGGRAIGPNFDKAKHFVHSAGSAVAGGARAILERSSTKNYNNFKHAVKRLDEVSSSVQGDERKQALERWLGALAELHKDSKIDLKEEVFSPSEPTEDEESQQSRVTSVLFYDSERTDEPLTFRDVFLQSQALENIAMSLVTNVGTEEEIKLFLELCCLCLSGGPELHHALVSGLQDLGKVMADYSELLVKKVDLLNMVSEAVSGLKLSAEGERLAAEALRLESEFQAMLEGTQLKPAAMVDPSELASQTQDLLQIGAHLVEVLKKQREVQAQRQAGDSEETRHAKVDKMKRVVDELKENEKAQKLKVADTRKLKAEALLYRVTKAQEVQEREKVIAGDMQVLQKKREALEAELNQVLAAISVQTQKHIELQEEKEQFDEASTNLVAHLAMQEEHLSKLITQHGGDTALAATWMSFLEDTWLLQSNSLQGNEEAVKESYCKSKVQVWKVALSAAASRKEELDGLLKSLEKCRNELAGMSKEGEGGSLVASREASEREYLRTEKKVKASLAAVEEVQSLAKILMEDPREEGDSKERPKFFLILQHIEELRKVSEASERPVILLETQAKDSPQAKGRKSKAKSSESWGSMASGEEVVEEQDSKDESEEK